MCEICLNSRRGSMTRRGALELTVSALAAGLVVPRAMAANDKPPPKPQNVIAPAAALDRLMKGNSRYVTGVSLRHDFMHEREALSTGQNPFAAVLSCADSRIAPEYCFNTVLDRLNCGVDRAACFVSEHHDQGRVEHLHGVFQAGNHFVAGEIAGDAADE